MTCLCWQNGSGAALAGTEGKTTPQPTWPEKSAEKMWPSRDVRTRFTFYNTPQLLLSHFGRNHQKQEKFSVERGVMLYSLKTIEMFYSKMQL